MQALYKEIINLKNESYDGVVNNKVKAEISWYKQLPSSLRWLYRNFADSDIQIKILANCYEEMASIVHRIELTLNHMRQCAVGKTLPKFVAKLSLLSDELNE